MASRMWQRTFRMMGEALVMAALLAAFASGCGEEGDAPGTTSTMPPTFTAAPTAPPPTTTTIPPPIQYVVERGDTVSGIAERFGLSVSQLVEANGLVNADEIKAGQVLVIPVAATTTTAAPPADTTPSTVTP